VTGGTASVTDYIAIDQGAGIKKLQVGDLPFASSASSVSSLVGGTNVNVSAATGAVTVNVDATMTGLTSVTSTDFVGALTGNADTATTAATVTGATQAAITSAANLVTVGTIGTGVWEGTDIAAGYLADTAVTPGAYTHASLTIDQQGRITAASSGAPGDIDGVTAGTGLSGGGTSGTVTLNFDPNSLTLATVAGGDKVAIADIDAAGAAKYVTAQSIADLGTTGDIEGVTAGTNLNGGGVSGTVTLNLDATLTGLTSVTSTDFVGALTGNADTATTAATVTGATQAAITSAANLVTVGTIGTGVWEGTDIAAGYIADTAVTPGSYTLASITVDQQGRLTAASTGSAGTGDVVGPGSAVDHSVARFDTTTGKLIQDTGSNFVITDAGIVTAGTWQGTDIAAGYIADTAVTPGSYTLSSITVDQQGRITAASSGAATGDPAGTAVAMAIALGG
jgi:hypothetical protein